MKGQTRIWNTLDDLETLEMGEVVITTAWSYNNVPEAVITERGFTGHEHLDMFGLINMNGRMYDPVTGRFLNVDPVIQDPSNSQNFNSYSYCLNNPLKYTDPTGYTMTPNPGEAYNQARLDGYSGTWQNFYSQYYDAYWVYREGGSSSFNLTWHTWQREPFDKDSDEPEIVEKRIDHSMVITMERARDPWWYEPADFLTTYLVGLDVLARLSGGLKEMPGCGQVGFFVQMVRSSHEIGSGDTSIYPKTDINASFVGTFLGLGGFIGGINYSLMDKICGKEAFAECFMNSINLYGEYGNPMFIRSWTH